MVKISAMGDANMKLQETIMAMTREKKELDMANVENTHRAAKVISQPLRVIHAFARPS